LNMPGISATGPGIFIREDGGMREISRTEWDEKFPGREPVVFEGEGVVRDFPGNYSLYRDSLKETETKEATIKVEKPIAVIEQPAKKKLSYKEQREFELLEKDIKALEKERREIYSLYNKEGLPYEEVQKLTERISILTNEIDGKELRWLELSENTP